MMELSADDGWCTEDCSGLEALTDASGESQDKKKTPLAWHFLKEESSAALDDLLCRDLK